MAQAKVVTAGGMTIWWVMGIFFFQMCVNPVPKGNIVEDAKDCLKKSISSFTYVLIAQIQKEKGLTLSFIYNERF